MSTRFSLSMEMSRLTRDGTAEPVSRDQILRHARGQGNINFPCSADHEQDWQPYPVDPYSAICDDNTYIHCVVMCNLINTYIPTTSVLSNKSDKYVPISFDQQSKFLKATHRTKIRKNEIPRSMVVEALSWWSRRASQHPAVQSPVHP